MNAPRFTIRVYGLLVHEGRVLVADELIKGRRVTKFPGGGLQYGEGPKECLVREIREELGVEAVDLDHFYTTDFFQQSEFHSEPLQVLGIYYRMRTADPLAIRTVSTPFQGITGPGDQEVFRWLALAGGTDDDLTLPIDRVVWALLRGA